MPSRSASIVGSDPWSQLIRQLYMRGFVAGVSREDTGGTYSSFESTIVLLNRMDRPIVLVIEDVGDSAGTTGVLEGEVEQLLDLCQHVDIVLLTTDRRWLDTIASLRFSHEVIGEQDLLFTTEDAEQALSERNIAHSHGDAEIARTVTSGLPGLMKYATAAFRNLLPTAPRGDHYLRTVSRSLDVYVEARIYRDDAIRHLHEFIDAIAAAESVDSELARALTGRAGTDQAVAELVDHGLLLVDRNTTRPGRWLFPPALREAILKRQRDEGHDPTPRLIFVARWHRDHGHQRDALLHAVQAQEWPLVIDIIDSHWITLLSQDVSMFRAALVAIPGSRISARPAMLAARQLLTGADSASTTSESLIPATMDALRALASSPQGSEALLAGTVHAVLIRLAGDFTGSAELCRRLAILRRFMHDTSPEVQIDSVALLHYQWSVSHQLAGSLQESGIEAAVAYRGSSVDELSFVARGSAGTSALNWALIGEHARANQWLERKVQQGLPDSWLEPIVRTAGLAARGLGALDSLDLDYARWIVEQLNTLSERSEMWPVIAHVRAGFELLNTRPALALDQLRRAKANNVRSVQPAGLATRLLLTSEIELLLACGLGNQADAAAGRAGDEDWAMILRARVYSLTGRDSQAVSLSRSLSQSADVSPRLLIDSLLIEASSALHLGELRTAAAAWTRAITLIDHLELPRSLTYLASRDVEALTSLVPGRSTSFRRVCSSGSGSVFPESVRYVELTEREGIVLVALAAGQGHTRIAKDLFVSTNTVKSQLRSAYKKLGAHTRDEALSAAREIGLLE
ncbi:LuxR C-terminal-related transcriptional regulator [Rhodococcus sp. IEGM1428]|uniref:helix-turn-helix transcriptional regulator n=1 Tax=Rhodococcus sp. IEGM1428 TaxID=3392191 RepID=UPI003D0CCB08